MLTVQGKQITGEFIRLRVLWAALCLASLVLWYWIELQTLTWSERAILISSFLALGCSEAFLAPRLRNRAGLTIALAMGEMMFLAWLAWSLASTGH